MTTVHKETSQDLIRKIRSLPANRQRVLRALLQQQGVDLSMLDAIPRAARSADDPVRLSYAQQRLWFLAQLDGTSAYYNIPMALRLRGRLDQPALRRALEEIIRRHEALRTRFVDRDGVPYQRIDEGTDFSVACEEAADPAHLRSICEREAVAPFDLERDCLIRTRLLRQSEQEHVLMVTMHHSVSDGWSLGVFFRDLVALYEAYTAGHASPLEPLPIQYADYAEWQRQWLVEEVQERQVEYWKQRLAGVNARLTLPADRPRPETKTYQGAHERFRCPAELLRRLQKLSDRYDATLYMTLLAVYQIALHRYSGQSDIAVGTPIAGRNRLETEGLIGFFVNTLVMRTDLAGDPTFAELLARVKETALRVYDHQDVPFEAVVDALGLERSLSHSPVFQTMFVLQERQDERNVRLGELEVSLVEFDFNITKFDVTLDLRETPDGLIGAVEYNTSLFERATIQRFVAHYIRLLGEVADDPEQRISRLDMLDEAERHQLLVAWNDTRRPYSDDRCVHELFEQAVARHPGRTAVVFGDREWSYRELDTWAGEVAQVLRRHGVGPDTVVGLYMERSAEMVAAIFGILKAGGAYMPLEPTHPAERTAYVIESSAVQVVVTQPHLAARFPGEVRHLLRLDGDGGVCGGDGAGGGDGLGAGAGVAGAGPRDLAYVIYTSGSTGRPKGVMVEHQAVVNRIEWMQGEYRLGGDDVVLQKTPFSFDVSVWEFVWPLVSGARLVVAEPEGHRDPGYLVSLIRRAGVTTLHFVPSMLRLVVEHEGWAGCGSVRRVFASGEALPGELAARHYARLSAPLFNLYGPTEAAIDVSHWACGAGEGPGTVPIGRPIQNIRLHVLDEGGRLAGVGCAGELYIAGAGLARGYLNNPGLTRERFVADPFGEPGARMYRTGDLVRRRSDGVLEFLGRIDGQVKIRGFRVELGEIEARLTQHASVGSCAVVLREDQPGNQQLVAYVVAGGAAADHDELTAHLGRTLPEYMVPSAFVTMEALPVTANGKLDRTALPVPGFDAYGQHEYVAPRPGTEQALAEIWAELLSFDRGRIGVKDNFFELGGHSLLITVLIARLKARGLDVTVRSVFNAPTLGRLAQEIDAAEAGAAFTAAPNLIPERCERITADMLPLVDLTQEQIDTVVATVPGGAANVRDIYPLVPAQEGILFHHLIDPDNDPYITPILLAADDEETCDRFVAALQSLIDRHDVLRTAVLTEGLPGPVQVVHREARLRVRRRTLDPGADAESQARELLERPGRMTLGRAPLLELVIAEDRGSARRFLLLSVHHLIEDATSLRLILEELVAHMSGRSEHLAPPVPYREFVASTLHRLAAGEAEALFREQLADVTEPTLPFGLTDNRSDARSVREMRRSLPAGLTADLRAVAKELRVSPATLFHAAWSILVAVCSGRDDVVFGTVLSGRLQGLAGVERMLGNFINTLPLRVRLAGKSVRDLVSDIDTGLKELVAHEQSSLVMAQRCSGLPGDVPLFSSMLNFRHFEPGRDGTGMPGVYAQGVRWVGSVDRTNYPVGLSIDDTGTELSLDAQADVSISVEALLDYVEVALSGIVAAVAADGGAGTEALAIEILPDAERRRLLADWNEIGRPYPDDRGLADLFEEQASLRPDAVAIEHGARTLTYAEANARANRVAHYLRERSVGPDTLVGLYAERSPETITGLLGILKAGGAYVPIDPGYPQERIDAIVRDSGVATVLSQSHLPAEPLAGVGQVVHLDTGEQAADGTQVLAGRPETDPDRAEAGTAPEHLAYVIFTSGSSGKPKGVQVEQRGVVRLMRNREDYFPTDEQTVVLHHSSISFDVGAQEVLGPLLNGARLVLHDGDSKDIVQLLDCIERSGVTMLALSAAFLPAFTEESRHRQLPLTYLAVGGEAFAARDVRALYAAHPGLTIVNAYGPTENSIASTCYAIPREIAEDAVVPIGMPVMWSTAHVTDDRLRLVPGGVLGELCVGGAGVARGYLGNPELTAERFVPDPFDDAPGARLYRTGDLVRRRSDGTLEFVRRVDGQVKVRGFRIELGEIETALHTHPAVHSAAVTTQDRGDGARLVAYVRPADAWLDTAADEGTGRPGPGLTRVLKEHLRAKVPSYMVPSVFVALEEFPVTANGKVDKKALPPPDEADVAGDSYVAPRTGTEAELCRIIADVLGLSRVGLGDTFFDLGGHSLLATRLTSRIRQETGRDLSLRLILGGASVVELAAALASQEESAVTGVAAPLPRGGTSSEAPLSLQQRELWFLNRHDHLGSAHDNVQMALRVVGRLDRAAYIRAFESLVERHAVLRTSYYSGGTSGDGTSTYRQRINDDSGFAVVQEHVSGDAAVAELLHAERARPFFPADRCMLRVHLLVLSEHEHVAVITRPWGIFDGWSTGILMAELNAMYTALARGDEPELPEPPLRYADFARWQQEAVGQVELERQAAYWRQQLAGLPARASLRGDYQRGPVKSYQGSAVDVAIPAELAGQLQRFSHESGVTLFMTLLSAFGVLVGMYTDDRELAIGCPVTNRPHPDLERVMGYFVNVLVMRLDVASGRRFDELLEQAKGVTAEAQEHKDVPLAAVTEALAADADPAWSPVFQVMFNLIPGPVPAPRDAAAQDIAALPVSSGDKSARFDLNLVLQETPAGLVGYLEYSTDLFARSTAQAMAALYQRLLLKIVTRPGASLAALRAAARDTEF